MSACRRSDEAASPLTIEPPLTRAKGASAAASSREDDRAWMAAETAGACLIHQWTEILKCLARGPIRVSDIAEELELDKANISHHLGGLRALGLVEFEQRGRDRLFRLSACIRIVRAGQRVVIRLRLSDLLRMVLSVRDLTSNLTPRAPSAGGVVAAAPASAPRDHGRDRSDGAVPTRPIKRGAPLSAPRRPRPRAR